MEYTNCCNAPFGYPGWPDCDLCSDCKEHAEPIKEDEYNEITAKDILDASVLHCEKKKSNDNPFELKDL